MNNKPTAVGQGGRTALKHTLTAFEIKVTEQIPAELRSYVQLRQEKPVNTIVPHDLKGYCHEIIVRAYFDWKGGESDDIILNFQTQALQEEFGKNPPFRQLTISEVREAFRKGIRGLYGEFFGMCPRTYHKFLSCYLEEENRAKAWMRYQELLEASAKTEEVNPETKLMRSKAAVLSLFDEYKKTKSLGVCPWAYYSVLAELIGTEVEYAPNKTYKTFVTDKAVRDRLNAEAEAEFEKEHKSGPPKDSIYDFETRAQKKVTAGDAVMRAIVQAGLKKEDALANKKKEVALRWYFDTLIAADKDLLV